MKYYKDALYIAANYAYNEEVVLPDMEELTIGDGKDFASKEEWIAARVQEWLDEAAIERAVQSDGSKREPTIITDFPMQNAYPAGHKPKRRR